MIEAANTSTITQRGVAVLVARITSIDTVSNNNPFHDLILHIAIKSNAIVEQHANIQNIKYNVLKFLH